MKKSSLLVVLLLALFGLNAKEYLQFNITVKDGENVRIETVSKNLGSVDLPQKTSGETVTKILKVPVTSRVKDINVGFRLTGRGKVRMTVQGVKDAAPAKKDDNNEGKKVSSTVTRWFTLDQVSINGKTLKPKRGTKFNVGTANPLLSTPNNKYSNFVSFKSGETINFHSTIAPAKGGGNNKKAVNSNKRSSSKKKRK